MWVVSLVSTRQGEFHKELVDLRIHKWANSFTLCVTFTPYSPSVHCIFPIFFLLTITGPARRRQPLRCSTRSKSSPLVPLLIRGRRWCSRAGHRVPSWMLFLSLFLRLGSTTRAVALPSLGASSMTPEGSLGEQWRPPPSLNLLQINHKSLWFPHALLLVSCFTRKLQAPWGRNTEVDEDL